MFVNHDFTAATAAPVASLVQRSGLAFPLSVESICASGFNGHSEAPLLAGEDIVISLPGVGRIEARVVTAGRSRFTAEWLGSNALRLRFLNGWTGRA